MKQHRLVNEILKDEISGIHGLTVRALSQFDKSHVSRDAHLFLSPSIQLNTVASGAK